MEKKIFLSLQTFIKKLNFNLKYILKNIYKNCFIYKHYINIITNLSNSYYLI
jgi:hypothetical protein